MEHALYTFRKAVHEDFQTLVNIDDEACFLYARLGLEMAFANNHPFVVAESERWMASTERGLTYVAVDAKSQAVGFIALRMVDNEPYIDQLSVKPDCMRKGIGTELLKIAITWSNHRPLWLTTYAHVSWNKPFYERRGFHPVQQKQCKPELQAILKEQRTWLPDPEQRIAMVRRTSTP